jgi:hypothetical protein
MAIRSAQVIAEDVQRESQNMVGRQACKSPDWKAKIGW